MQTWLTRIQHVHALEYTRDARTAFERIIWRRALPKHSQPTMHRALSLQHLPMHSTLQSITLAGLLTDMDVTLSGITACSWLHTTHNHA